MLRAGPERRRGGRTPPSLQPERTPWSSTPTARRFRVPQPERRHFASNVLAAACVTTATPVHTSNTSRWSRHFDDGYGLIETVLFPTSTVTASRAFIRAVIFRWEVAGSSGVTVTCTRSTGWKGELAAGAHGEAGAPAGPRRSSPRLGERTFVSPPAS